MGQDRRSDNERIRPVHPSIRVAPGPQEANLKEGWLQELFDSMDEERAFINKMRELAGLGYMKAPANVEISGVDLARLISMATRYDECR